jgi:autotransporter-associated beta strand protein
MGKIAMNGFRTLGIAVILLAASAAPVFASTVTWDSDGVFGNGVSDGSGVWDTATANWYGAGPDDQTWNNANIDTARFGTGTGGVTPYTVTLNAPITAGGLLFQNQNYTLTGNTLTFPGTAASIDVASGQTAQIDSILTGASANVSKVGNGTLILTASNSGLYGIRSVNAGILRLTHNSAMGGTAFHSDVSSGATLEVTGNLTGITRTVFLQGAGVGGAGALHSVGATNNVFAGRVNLGSSANSTINVDAGGTLTLNQGVQTWPDTNRGLTKIGDGTLVMLGDDSNYAAGTTISAGTLRVGNGGTTGSVPGAVTNNASLVFNRSNTLTVSGVISGSGTVSQIGTGTLILSGANTYTGVTNVNAGILQINHATALGATSAGTNVADGAALVVNVATDINEPVTLNGLSNPNGALQFTQTNWAMRGKVVLNATSNVGGTASWSFGGTTVSGPGGLVKVGNNTIYLDGATGSYLGPTTINSGTLAIKWNTNHIPDNSALTIAAGAKLTIDSGVTNETIGSLAGAGLVDLSAASANTTLTVGNDNSSSTFSGVLNDSGAGSTLALTKVGTGTLTLSGTNTYAGATNVNAGTLLANNMSGSGTGSGPVNVNGGMLGGTGSIGGAVNVLAAGTISAGASPGLLSIVGNYTQSGTLLAEIAGATVGSQYDQIAVTGSATLNPGATIDVSLLDGFQPVQGATFDILTAAGGITNLDLSGVQFDFSAGGLVVPALYWSAAIVNLNGSAEAIRLTVAVPEPSTIALLALGIAGMGLCVRRRRKV